MAEGFIQLPVNSTGTKMRTVENTVGANIVDQSVSTLADSAGNLVTVISNRLAVDHADPDLVTTGTITATDAVVAAPAGDGTTRSGASTAGSTVVVALAGGDSAWNVLITGQTTGNIYFEESMDSTTGADGTWINVNGRQTGVVNTVLAGNATAGGYWRGNTSGAKYFRVRQIGTLTGTPAVTIRISGGIGAVFLNASIPAGTNSIGTTSLNAALPTGTNSIGNIATVAAVTAITNALPAGANTIGAVNAVQAAITKGTQGTTGVTTQDLKDAGRNPVTYYMVIPVLSTATDTLQSLTGTKAGATVTATTTPAVVTAGKTLRVQRFWATYIATATSGYAIARLRFNTGGVVAITSPLAHHLAVGTSAPATANAGDTKDAVFPDGLEFAAGTGIGISVQGFAAATATAVGYMLVGISGFEY